MGVSDHVHCKIITCNISWFQIRQDVLQAIGVNWFLGRLNQRRNDRGGRKLVRQDLVLRGRSVGGLQRRVIYNFLRV